MDTVIAKKYRVLKSLGHGAMGEVFLVLPPKGDAVALKLLKTLEAKANKEAIEQFENEFKTLKRLSHPNIGRIFDYGYDQNLNKVFFTLPWLKGCDIYEATQAEPFSQCEEYFVQALRALNYLHQKNLIHCDLKPGNIHVENKQVCLIDFGLAGYWGENIVGTPTYLAPEIFRGERHTVASDLYALGVIFYNCFTRSQPFSGKNLQEVYDRHRSFTPPPIHELNNKVPKYFSDIIANLLNKKPLERFPTAAAVIEEIDAYSNMSYSVETEQTLLSYLPTESELVGRAEAIRDVRQALKDFKSAHVVQPYHLILIHGPKNIGKSKVVAKIKNELQLSKISVEHISTPITENLREVLLNANALILENLENYFISKGDYLSLKQITDLLEQKALAMTEKKQLFIISSTEEKHFETIKRIFPAEENLVTTIALEPFSIHDTEDFLMKVIGQPEIPKAFVEKFHHNTEGLPGIGLELIQSMIAGGLLFDKSGRWNEDLLVNLNKVFDCLVVSENLEQEFEKVYNGLAAFEEDIVIWLSICPHALHRTHLQKLTHSHDLEKVLHSLSERKIIRENNQEYTLYRSVFKNFIQNNLPDTDVAKRHTMLAHKKIGLSKTQSIYHLSLGQVLGLRLKATEKLADMYENNGDRESALATYGRLLKEFANQPVQKRLDWCIKAASIMIWLDKFEEAITLMTKFEKEIKHTRPSIDRGKFLTLIEKKGLALLHKQNIESAKTYFRHGLKLAQRLGDHKMQQMRFENNLAEIEFVLGNQKTAIETFKRTRELAKNLSNIEMQNITNNDLGHVYLQLHKFDESLPYLKEDIKIFSNLRNKAPLARALYSFAEALRSKNNYETAIKAYQECVRLCKKTNNHPLLLRAYNGLGNLHLSLEHYEESIKNYQRAIDIAVRLNEVTSKAALLFNQGFIYRKDKNTALAARRYLMAKQVLENKGSQLLAYEENLLSRCYNELAVLAKEENNNMKALSFQLERMKLISESEILKSEKMDVKFELAVLYLENRLMEQFKNEVKSLENMATNAADIERLKQLKQSYKNVIEFDDQNTTGVITNKSVV